MVVDTYLIVVCNVFGILKPLLSYYQVAPNAITVRTSDYTDTKTDFNSPGTKALFGATKVNSEC